VLAYLLLVVGHAAGLVLLGFGAPGIWLQLAALTFFGWLTDFALIRVPHISTLLLLTVSAEVFAMVVARRGSTQR